MDVSAAAMAGSLEVNADELDLLATDLPTADDLLDSADDAPAIRLINGVIAEAARQGVSDIHIEPYETGLVVRMRIDGVLRETLRMPPHVAPVVVSRSEEHTYELQSLMRNSYAVFCLQKKNSNNTAKIIYE